jgi:hypothetical protein
LIMTTTKLFRLGLAFGLLLPVVGCGPRLVTVTGKVALADGTPYTNGTVWFNPIDSYPYAGQGVIGPDGTFRLGTLRPGEGIAPGRYSVLVNTFNDNITVDTQGMEVTVVNGPNHFDVTVVVQKAARKK